ncbi:hypothetical protein [Enterobacter asburiae]|uniref:hypothetical protein n=1 Tax=Enterobacter asburiae TaxID=61645 RepID=UPI0021D309B7|nr:hypothetical protein [Enterobacter asburiae]
MSTISKEQIEQYANAARLIQVSDFDKGKLITVEPEHMLELARIALASLEAEPVAEVCEGFTLRYIGHGPVPKSGVHIGDRLFTAPPAPASMKYHQIRELVNELRDIAVEYHGTQQLRERIARTVRAAMLQGAEPVTTACKLPSPIKDNHLNSGPDADDYYSGYQAGWNELLEAVSGNPQAIPDGWKLVPVDMTPEQMRAVQLKSELGSYAAANLTGAYSLFREFWDVAVTAATQRGERK